MKDIIEKKDEQIRALEHRIEILQDELAVCKSFVDRILDSPATDELDRNTLRLLQIALETYN